VSQCNLWFAIFCYWIIMISLKCVDYTSINCVSLNTSDFNFLQGEQVFGNIFRISKRGMFVMWAFTFNFFFLCFKIQILLNSKLRRPMKCLATYSHVTHKNLKIKKCHNTHCDGKLFWLIVEKFNYLFKFWIVTLTNLHIGVKSMETNYLHNLVHIQKIIYISVGTRHVILIYPNSM
jgi:hypothetical protein